MVFSFFPHKTTKRYSYRKFFTVLSIILRLRKRGTEFWGNDHHYRHHYHHHRHRHRHRHHHRYHRHYHHHHYRFHHHYHIIMTGAAPVIIIITKRNHHHIITEYHLQLTSFFRVFFGSL